MKKILLLLLGFLLGALVTYYYCCKQPITEEPIRPPSGLITPAQAVVLDTTYNPRYTLVSDSIVKRKGGDNRSSWYSLSDMRTYLNYAEKQADSLGFKMDGIRVYLGAHPEFKGVPGYTTMFFIPTGIPNTSNASMFNFQKSLDIPGGNGLNGGGDGDPPSSNYPQ